MVSWKRDSCFSTNLAFKGSQSESVPYPSRGHLEMFWGCFACHNDWKAYRHLLNSRQLNFFRTVFRTRNYSPHRTSIVSLWERLLDSLYFFPSQWGFSKSFELSTSYSFLNILQIYKKTARAEVVWPLCCQKHCSTVFVCDICWGGSLPYYCLLLASAT